MGKIAELAKSYEKFIKKKYIYYLDDGTSFNVIFEKKRFAHLLGLHKIIDVPQLQKLSKKQYSGARIFKEVKEKIISDKQIFESHYFEKIENRYIHFLKLEDIVFQKVVYHFDKTKAVSKIDADMMLYSIENNMYLHLFLVKAKNGDMVPMTFIVEETDAYVKGQIYSQIRELHVKENGKEDEIHTYIDNAIKSSVAITSICEEEAI